MDFIPVRGAWCLIAGLTGVRLMSMCIGLAVSFCGLVRKGCAGSLVGTVLPLRLPYYFDQPEEGLSQVADCIDDSHDEIVQAIYHGDQKPDYKSQNCHGKAYDECRGEYNVLDVCYESVQTDGASHVTEQRNTAEYQVNSLERRHSVRIRAIL